MLSRWWRQRRGFRGRFNLTIRYADSLQQTCGPLPDHLEQALIKGLLEHERGGAFRAGAEIEIKRRWDAMDWFIAVAGLILMVIPFAIGVLWLIGSLIAFVVHLIF